MNAFAFFVYVGTLVAFSPSPTSPPHAIHPETSSQKPAERSGINIVIEIKDICAGPIPTGWIKMNDWWNPAICGKPTSTIVYNVFQVGLLSSVAVGGTMDACAGQSVPKNWKILRFWWNPGTCGHPIGQTAQNMMQILRLK